MEFGNIVISDIEKRRRRKHLGLHCYCHSGIFHWLQVRNKKSIWNCRFCLCFIKIWFICCHSYETSHSSVVPPSCNTGLGEPLLTYHGEDESRNHSIFLHRVPVAVSGNIYKCAQFINNEFAIINKIKWVEPSDFRRNGLDQGIHDRLSGGVRMA